jgi:predicted ATPase
MKIEQLKIKNYKVFKDVELRDLSDMAVFLGANGAGKTTLFDVFGFLGTALQHNVKTAINRRGGFKEVISRGCEGEISFEIKFRNTTKAPLITYELSIGLDERKQPVITKECLRYRRGQHGKPYKFLDFSLGKGMAIVNEEDFETEKQNFKEEREEQTLDAPDILAIKGLGQFQRFKAIS